MVFGTKKVIDFWMLNLKLLFVWITLICTTSQRKKYDIMTEVLKSYSKSIKYHKPSNKTRPPIIPEFLIVPSF